jgi:hypothetical protein
LQNDYVPKPIPVETVEIDLSLDELVEALARNAHDLWASQRIAERWTWGPERSDQRREHPGLVEFEALSDTEKEYDRILVRGTLRAILALGYRITR